MRLWRWGRRCVVPQQSVGHVRAVDVHLGDHVERHQTTTAFRLAHIEAVGVLRAVYLTNAVTQHAVSASSLPQSNLERAQRSRTTTYKVPIGYNGTPKIHPQNCPFPSTITTAI